MFNLATALAEHGLTGQPLGVGVSGGADSVALIRALHAEAVPGLHVLHLNHNWPGPFGAQAQAFVEKLAQTLGLPCVVGQGAPPPETNREAHARAQRLAFFAAQTEKLNLSAVLVAHTQTDVAENVLLRLAKGSGVQGLAAMPAVATLQGVKLVRPLLHLGRESLEAYLAELGQPFLTDPSNAASARGKLRAAAPLLAGLGLTPASISASAKALKQAQSVILREVNRALVQVQFTPTTARVELAVVRQLLPEVATQVLGAIITQLTHAPLPPRRKKRFELMVRLNRDAAGKATLGGCIWVWSAGALIVQPEAVRAWG